jgi:diacylglycerol kinase family enzyme
MGGDATLSAAALAAVRCGVPFVPVPRGFGNIFARVFGHPDGADAIVALLEHGEIWKVDVGQADGEIFLSHRSFGFLEDVQNAVETSRDQPAPGCAGTSPTTRRPSACCAPRCAGSASRSTARSSGTTPWSSPSPTSRRTTAS